MDECISQSTQQIYLYSTFQVEFDFTVSFSRNDGMIFE